MNRYEIIVDSDNYLITARHTGIFARDIYELDITKYDFTNNRLRAYKLVKNELVFDEQRYQEIVSAIDRQEKDKEIEKLQKELDDSDYIVSRAFEEVMALTNPLTWVADVIKITTKYALKYKEVIANRSIWRKKIEELRK